MKCKECKYHDGQQYTDDWCCIDTTAVVRAADTPACHRAQKRDELTNNFKSVPEVKVIRGSEKLVDENGKVVGEVISYDNALRVDSAVVTYAQTSTEGGRWTIDIFQDLKSAEDKNEQK